MSKNVLRNAVSTPFSDSVLPLSELPPPDQRGTGRIGEIVKRQKEEIRKAAFDLGVEQGFEHGRVQGAEEARTEANTAYEAEIALFVARLQEVESTFGAAFDKWLAETEEQLGALAVVIAERLLRMELGHSRDSVISIAQEVVSEVRHGTKVRMRVNPFDEGLVEARKAEILAASVGLRSIEVVTDPDVQGGCVIESDGGLIDARIEAALERIMLSARVAAV